MSPILLLAGILLINPTWTLAPPRHETHLHARNTNNWLYTIPNNTYNTTAAITTHIKTPNGTLPPSSLLHLDNPQTTRITPSSYDWWYYDAISSTNPLESLTITLFTSTQTAFPWLDPSDTSTLIAYLWATFPNGTSFMAYLPAKLALVSGSEEMGVASMGSWQDTGFSWVSSGGNFSRYEVFVESEEMGVFGSLRLKTGLAPHLPCGIQSNVSTLEVLPDVGWASLIPDARAVVNMSIQGSPLNFQGRGYHDKNWSNKTFTSSVSSWYWGHGRMGNYSIVWFSAIDAKNQSHVSSYVARDGEVLLSSCDGAKLLVRPTGVGNEARYPPLAGDIPKGFMLEFDLGREWLRVNASIVADVTGDGEYYMRWTAKLEGEIWDSNGGSKRGVEGGVAVLEQFALVE